MGLNYSKEDEGEALPQLFRQKDSEDWLEDQKKTQNFQNINIYVLIFV